MITARILFLGVITGMRVWQNCLLIRKNYGTEAALKLLIQTEKSVKQIALYPNLFPGSAQKSLHKAIINKQTSLVYRVKASRIELAHFGDNRQNPDKMKDLLK